MSSFDEHLNLKSAINQENVYLTPSSEILKPGQQIFFYNSSEYKSKSWNILLRNEIYWEHDKY